MFPGRLNRLESLLSVKNTHFLTKQVREDKMLFINNNMQQLPVENCNVLILR
jgi:hypothetical protein